MNSEITMYTIIDEFLKTVSAKQTSDIDQIIVRCRFCGDSDNINNAHMYIGYKDNSNGAALLYHCKKCDVFGRVSEEFLRKYEIDIKPEYKKLLKYHEKLFNSDMSADPTIIMKEKFKFNYLDNKIFVDKNIEKIKYLEKRFAKKLTNGLIDKYSIVLNVVDFLKTNNVYNMVVKNSAEVNGFPKFLDNIDKFYVGFLTTCNNYIICRKVNEGHSGQRYINFQIDNKVKTKYFFNIATQFDPLADNPKIILTEGIFDIIGVYERFGLKDSTDSYYSGVCSTSNYENVVFKAMSKSGYIDADIHVYSDNDVDLDFFKTKLAKMKHLNIYIHYNTLGKDWGELSEDVKIETKRLIF